METQLLTKTFIGSGSQWTKLYETSTDYPMHVMLKTKNFVFLQRRKKGQTSLDVPKSRHISSFRKELASILSALRISCPTKSRA